MFRRLLAAFLLAAVLLSGITGIALSDEPSTDAGEKMPALEYNSLDELRDAKVFAIPIGTIFDEVIRDLYPGAEIRTYPGLVECALALTTGKVNAFMYDAPSLKYLASGTPGVAVLPEYVMTENYHFILPKSDRGRQLQTEFNEWLNGLRATGELKEIVDFWCGGEEPEAVPDFTKLPADRGFIHITTAPGTRPDVYYPTDGVTGLPVDLLYRFCRDCGYGGEITVVSADNQLPSVVTGKADFLIGLFSYTEERAESVLFTDPIMEGGVAFLVRVAGGTGEAETGSFMESLEKTFIREDRWKLILSGLGVTLLVTAGGFLLANLLGAVFCACAMSRHKAARLVSEVFNRLMQGTPIVVVLMILYYVVFGKTRISGIPVAIIAFGLASGASLAQLFQGAIRGVDKGQTEAALAIGFTKFRAFVGIVLPQAVRSALPGYFSELISLMKGTAIVGYIAVNDLTKASDLIRSSTYEAFFPLLSVAVIYFLIAFVILSLLRFLQRRLTPVRKGNAAEKEAVK